MFKLFTGGFGFPAARQQHRQWTASQPSTAQHSTAQHSTAQHSTAQHSTAQHSTAQYSTDALGSSASIAQQQSIYIVYSCQALTNLRTVLCTTGHSCSQCRMQPGSNWTTSAADMTSTGLILIASVKFIRLSVYCKLVMPSTHGPRCAYNKPAPCLPA